MPKKRATGTHVVTNTTIPYLIWGDTATSTGSTAAAWTHWVEAAASCACGDGNSSSTAATQVWRIWSEAQGTTVGGGATGRIIQPTHGMGSQLGVRGRVSPEERALRDQRERELQAAYEKEKAARVLAEQKAEILLRQMLTPEQRESLDQKKCFYLHVGDKRYRIDRGRTGNVKLVDDKDQVVESYCIHPVLNVPDADTMLAQKLLLETDLKKFETVANITARSARGRTRSGVGRTG